MDRRRLPLPLGRRREPRGRHAVGRFRIYRKAVGWQRSYLGAMYYPSYFTAGYAIHGSPSVPAGPVSHGCVRIGMSAAIGFFQRNPGGTPVIIVP